MVCPPILKFPATIRPVDRFPVGFRVFAESPGPSREAPPRLRLGLHQELVVEASALFGDEQLEAQVILLVTGGTRVNLSPAAHPWPGRARPRQERAARRVRPMLH